MEGLGDYFIVPPFFLKVKSRADKPNQSPAFLKYRKPPKAFTGFAPTLSKGIWQINSMLIMYQKECKAKEDFWG